MKCAECKHLHNWYLYGQQIVHICDRYNTRLSKPWMHGEKDIVPHKYCKTDYKMLWRAS